MDIEQLENNFLTIYKISKPFALCLTFILLYIYITVISIILYMIIT